MPSRTSIAVPQHCKFFNQYCPLCYALQLVILLQREANAFFWFIFSALVDLNFTCRTYQYRVVVCTRNLYFEFLKHVSGLVNFIC